MGLTGGGFDRDGEENVEREGGWNGDGGVEIPDSEADPAGPSSPPSNW